MGEVPLLDMQIRRSAEISPCRTYRWALERRWDEGAPCLWIMLNPSIADDTIDDPTMKRVIHFTRSWGHPAARVVNLYPFRSSSPRELRAWYMRDETAVTMTHTNRGRIALEIPAAAAVVAAWGNLDSTDDLDWEWLDRLAPAVTLFCLGFTKLRMPIHPMARGKHRVPDDARPIVWRAMTGGRGGRG